MYDKIHHKLKKKKKKKKTNKQKKTLASNDTLYLMNLVVIYRTFQPKTAEYTFFSSTHGIFSKKEHMLSHKTSFNKFKKTEIIPSILFNHDSMRWNQLQEKKTLRKIHKHVEAEQYNAKQQMGHWRNQTGNQKI